MNSHPSSEGDDAESKIMSTYDPFSTIYYNSKMLNTLQSLVRDQKPHQALWWSRIIRLSLTAALAFFVSAA